MNSIPLFLSSHLDKFMLGYRNLRLIKITNAPLCSIPRLSLPYFSDVKLLSPKQLLISLHILLKTMPTLLILPFKSTAFPIHLHSKDPPVNCRNLTILVSSQNAVIKILPFHCLGHVMSIFASLGCLPSSFG